MKVLVVPDKFKGTLTAHEAAAAIVRGWAKSRAYDQLECLPMSDGGDGFGEVMGALLHAETQITKTVDAAHRPIDASWAWHAGTKTAILEAARVVGLAQLPKGKYHPFELDTEGLGMVLQAAYKKGARHCWVGIGGSATNDGGFGLATALGWQFFNVHGERILRWTELHTLSQIRPPTPNPVFKNLVVAVDVQNPLLGPEGCTRVYGPQKGLLPTEFEFAEKSLRRMVDLLAKELHLHGANLPGAGAAGGLGFGLHSFAGARLAPGFELFAEHAGIARRLAELDLVITGEGSIDESTLMGKGVGQLAHLCQQANVPCLALGGHSPIVTGSPAPFTRVEWITKLTAPEDALNRPAYWLEELAARTAASWR